jgi:hypothetical protein
VTDESTKAISDFFRKMADDIDRNAGAGFGGAFVCVPPTNGGDAFQTLIVGEATDASDYWVLLKSKAEAQIRAADAQARQGQAFGGRR